MNVALNINQELFARIVTEAKLAAFKNDSWMRAIDKAVLMLERNPLATWDGHTLLLMSPNSSNIYQVNGACIMHGFGRLAVPCPAYRHKNPCWHRSLARLIQNYFQAAQVELINRGRLELRLN